MCFLFKEDCIRGREWKAFQLTARYRRKNILFTTGSIKHVFVWPWHADRNTTPGLFSVQTLHKHLLVDPHERARVVGLALVLDAVEAVSPLAVVPLVVVVVLHLPHGFKHPQLRELGRGNTCTGERARRQTVSSKSRAASFGEAQLSHSKLTSPETHNPLACVKVKPRGS